MSTNLLQVDKSGRVKQGVIVVGHNFLAKDRSIGEANLCELFSGYITGVLENILRSRVSVRHPEELCMRIDHNRMSCDFHFETGSNKPSKDATASKNRSGSLSKR